MNCVCFNFSQLDTTLHSRAAETQDINQITEEFTQRLSSLEKKFQQSIREKESLRKQLDVIFLDISSYYVFLLQQLFLFQFSNQKRRQHHVYR